MKERNCIMLPWSSAPALNYWGLFLSGCDACSTSPSQTALQSCDFHVYSVRLLAHGFCLCHLLVALSVGFANSDTAHKVHYHTNN